VQFFEWLAAHFEQWAAQIPDPFLRKALLYPVES